MPSMVFSWDTGNINVVAPTPTHRTSGYVNNEIPTAAETNGILTEIAADLGTLNTAETADAAAIAALQSWKAATRTVAIPIGVPTSAGTASSANGLVATPSLACTVSGGPSNAETFAIPIALPVGTTIKAVRARILDASLLVQTIRVESLSTFTSSTPTTGWATAIAAGTGSAGNATVQTISTSSSGSVVVAASVSYRAAIVTNGTNSGTITLYGIEVDYIPPQT